MTSRQAFDHLGTARFITFTCYQRHRYLTTHTARWIVVNGLDFMRRKRSVRILAWVIMPEHVHFVLIPPNDSKLVEPLGRFKSWTSKEMLKGTDGRGRILHRNDGSPAIWQRRWYDHNCRSPQVVLEKIHYCHKNPVSRGLIRSLSDWPWSSYNWYSKEGRVVLEIDGIRM